MTGRLNPNISVDCVVFGFDRDCLRVLLVEREIVFHGDTEKTVRDYKLPGSLVYNEELLKDAARRVLHDLTGIGGICLERYDVLDSLERMDNRVDRQWLEQTTGLSIERVVSVAFFGLVNMNDPLVSKVKDGARWMDLDETKQLPFDHSAIIERALAVLQQRLRVDATAFGLLPEKFTIAGLQQVFEVIGGEKLDSRNFRKKLKNLHFIVPLREKQRNVAHKPARLYSFDHKRFLQSRKSISFF